ncbi:MAG: UDP-N-acetylmuramoyl-tripeptide--D-alanyl-D-alanine ligase, partial [Acidobacteria bacterium]|nr:UDP-N-acetylmuramoyl-tripeptide--D-alanyl-D-alanine ligase [Acidobacteriota bacterium]
MRLALSRIAELIGANPAPGSFAAHQGAAGYSIDSRTVAPGEVFFAVKGERLDGHDFVSQALMRGALAAVVSQERLSSVV